MPGVTEGLEEQGFVRGSPQKGPPGGFMPGGPLSFNWGDKGVSRFQDRMLTQESRTPCEGRAESHGSTSACGFAGESRGLC